MLRVTKELDRRHDGRRQRPQALDDRPRIVEPSHMLGSSSRDARSAAAASANRPLMK